MHVLLAPSIEYYLGAIDLRPGEAGMDVAPNDGEVGERPRSHSVLDIGVGGSLRGEPLGGAPGRVGRAVLVRLVGLLWSFTLVALCLLLMLVVLLVLFVLSMRFVLVALLMLFVLGAVMRVGAVLVLVVVVVVAVCSNVDGWGMPRLDPRGVVVVPVEL